MSSSEIKEECTGPMPTDGAQASHINKHQITEESSCPMPTNGAQASHEKDNKSQSNLLIH